MEFKDFLAFLQGPGINVAVGIAISFLVEYWSGYDGLTPKVKRLVMLGLCFIIPVVAKVTELGFFGGIWGDFPLTWWPIIVAAFSAFTGSQAAHTRKLGE